MTVSGRGDLIDISGPIKNQTEKAVLFDDGKRAVWLAKSLVEVA